MRRRKEPRAPSLGEIRRREREVALRAMALYALFAHAIEFGYEPGGWPPRELPAERGHAGRGEGDPTGEVVASRAKENARRAVRSAFELLEEAGSALRAAEAQLEGAFPREPSEQARGPFPRTATRAELADSREAQERRRARGEV